MIRDIFDPAVDEVIRQAREAATEGRTKSISLNGRSVQVASPFPSPGDWRDCWIYFLMIDRFNNPERPPNSTRAEPPIPWNGIYDYRQGGTFNGVRRQLDYLAKLGVGAIWLSPVLKNPRPDWPWNYHGYAAQNFLALDERFGSDGTPATAERELTALIEEAHARGIYVILDIVLNHTGRVFDYVRSNDVVDSFSDPALMHGDLGSEAPVQWLNGFGFPRADWQDVLPAAGALSSDDAVWPADLQRPEFFRRRGTKLGDDPDRSGFVKGDFGVMRQLVVEYDAGVRGQEIFRAKYGPKPVLSILVRAYQYLVARFDFDGFRIDTVKYVDPQAVQTFGNAMREFSLSVGKHNFFTFGEIYDDEETIAAFVGRNGGNTEGYGIDAALDFPLFFALPQAAKGNAGVESVRQVFENRKQAEKELLSSHGEAGRYFVSFLDNHDQHERFKHPNTPPEQVVLALGALFTLQGIPCLYYGTEQGLVGAADAAGNPALGPLESVREALWGKNAPAFDEQQRLFNAVKAISDLRRSEPALRYGRLYFRQVSGNGRDFGYSTGAGGILAYSRILSDRELLVVANTNHDQAFAGHVLVDLDLNRRQEQLQIAYSSHGSVGRPPIDLVADAGFWESGLLSGRSVAAAVPVALEPMEIQIIRPAP